MTIVNKNICEGVVFFLLFFSLCYSLLFVIVMSIIWNCLNDLNYYVLIMNRKKPIQVCLVYKSNEKKSLVIISNLNVFFFFNYLLLLCFVCSCKNV